MIMTIIIVLILLWLLGLIANIGGGLIHLVLLIALVIFVYDWVTRRRGRV